MHRKLTPINTLRERYRQHISAPRERYEHVLRGNCARSGGQERFERAKLRFRRMETANNPLEARVFVLLTGLRAEGKIHTVRNGKVIATRRAA